MQLEPRLVSRRLSVNDFASLYLLHGEEAYMIDEMLALMKEKIMGDGGLADFNLSTFYATDTEVETISDTIQTLPMMAPRRLVIVRQAEDFSASDLEKLTPLIEKPVDTTTAVFVATKIDMRKKFFKAFDQKGIIAKFQKPFDNQIIPWIHQIAKKHGKTLTHDAAELIKECVGAHLTDINNEIAKASQFYPPSQTELGVEDLKAIVSRTRVDNVFQLVNCMGERDAANSFIHLANLLDHGENEIAVLTMIIRHYRILILCSEGLKEGLTPTQIASRVGVHGFFIKDYINQGRSQNLKDLQKIYTILLDTDRALKSNPLSSHLWLENLVLQACNLGSDSKQQPKISPSL